MILEEITLGKDEKSKRETIQKYFGRQVILNDQHEFWCHGLLLNEGFDDFVYQMQLQGSGRRRNMHYPDLKQLLVIVNHPDEKYNPKPIEYKPKKNKKIKL